MDFIKENYKGHYDPAYVKRKINGEFGALKECKKCGVDENFSVILNVRNDFFCQKCAPAAEEKRSVNAQKPAVTSAPPKVTNEARRQDPKEKVLETKTPYATKKIPSGRQRVFLYISNFMRRIIEPFILFYPFILFALTIKKLDVLEEVVAIKVPADRFIVVMIVGIAVFILARPRQAWLVIFPLLAFPLNITKVKLFGSTILLVIPGLRFVITMFVLVIMVLERLDKFTGWSRPASEREQRRAGIPPLIGAGLSYYAISKALDKAYPKEIRPEWRIDKESLYDPVDFEKLPPLTPPGGRRFRS